MSAVNPFETQLYDAVVKAIIRPPRAIYSVEMLGSRSITRHGLAFIRRDFELRNERGEKLQCSWWAPSDPRAVLPCVVYLHGNAGCRVDALSVANQVLALHISLFAFDFSGSGKSDGDYISLGWWERDDVKVVVEYLREQKAVSTIGLWGRSMGAATALLHGDRDPSIAGMVVDSPFTGLTVLAQELVNTQFPYMPSILTYGALQIVASSCREKVHFEIADLEPISHVDMCFIPALFATGDADDFIHPHHCYELHERYAGDKEIVQFAGDHHSGRTPEFFERAALFLHERLSQVAGHLERSSESAESRKLVLPEHIGGEAIEHIHITQQQLQRGGIMQPQGGMVNRMPTPQPPQQGGMAASQPNPAQPQNGTQNAPQGGMQEPVTCARCRCLFHAVQELTACPSCGDLHWQQQAGPDRFERKQAACCACAVS